MQWICRAKKNKLLLNYGSFEEMDQNLIHFNKTPAAVLHLEIQSE